MITQRAKWISDRPSNPVSVVGSARATMNSSRFSQVHRGFIGVTTFIP